MMGKEDTNGMKACGDSRAELGRTVEGKILTGDRVKTRGKEVGNTKWLIIMMSTDRAK